MGNDHPDFKELAYKSVLKKMLSQAATDQEFTHNFQLSSAYSGNIMPYTNYTFDFKGVIDYIFHPPSMRPLGILGPISDDWLTENKIVGCPHPHITSDHFSLLVELGLSPPHSHNNHSNHAPPSSHGVLRR